MNPGQNKFTAIPILLLAIVATGCTSSITPTPIQPALADSFFSGQALLDANGNGKIDSEDTPIANATFIVTLQGGGEFGDQTDETGKAFVTVSGGAKYPVTVRMEPPKDSGLMLLEPQKAILNDAVGNPIQFLFSPK